MFFSPHSDSGQAIMATEIDPYAPCPCGSGKKYKWCCQPISDAVEAAFGLQNAGQGEAALRAMEIVVQENPANPVALARQAQLQIANNQGEEAEKTLERAFQIKPDFGLGFMIQGMMRLNEGETVGALLLFRKAYDAMDPAALPASDLLELIGDQEMRRNQPVAARYAFTTAAAAVPANAELAQALDYLFGEDARLPAAARFAYEYLDPKPTTTRLSETRTQLQTVCGQADAPANAFFNLGLTLAWLGDHPGALAALETFGQRSPDADAVRQATALSAVLRCGQTAIEHAEYLEHYAFFQYRDPQRLGAVIGQLQEKKKLLLMEMDQERGLIVGLIILPRSTLDLSSSRGALSRPVARFMHVPGVVRLSFANPEPLAEAVAELQKLGGDNFSPPTTGSGPVQFGDVLLEALLFPQQQTTWLEIVGPMREQAAHFFENVWVERPLKSLGQKTPTEAAADPALRGRLLGCIDFIEQCMDSCTPRLGPDAATGAPADTSVYDFDRLRHKLGLGGPAAVTAAPTADEIDIESLHAADLGAFPVATASDAQLERAVTTARKLGENDLAERFARALIARPANAERPDRFRAYQFLAQQATKAGDLARAGTLWQEAATADREANQGQRASDIDGQRAQVLVKQGQYDEAVGLFDQLIGREPAELKHYLAATESLLSKRQGASALRFAEAGLEQAREQGNRDAEGNFQELASAARKQG